MSNASDLWHKQQYEAAFAWVGRPCPAWEDLTDEQRASIRKTNGEYQSFMDDLGNAIASGGELPDPLKGLR